MASRAIWLVGTSVTIPLLRGWLYVFMAILLLSQVLQDKPGVDAPREFAAHPATVRFAATDLDPEGAGSAAGAVLASDVVDGVVALDGGKRDSHGRSPFLY
jgi:hypothetical protein